jgi:predicted HTH transcriptional regulator
MTLAELKKICGKGETQNIEFKQYASEPNQIIEEISGFLNATGGRLFVGVNDDGTITGLKYAEDDLNFLRERLKSAIKPSIHLDMQVVQVSKKRAVIVINIPEGEHKPYRAYYSETESSKIFFRVNDECIQASRELRSILKHSIREHGQTIRYSEIEAAVLKEIDSYRRRRSWRKRNLIQEKFQIV